MTLLGKLLALVNLVVGLGLLAWSVSLYTQRPGWFDPIPDNVAPGQRPVNFAQLKAEIDSLGRAAVAASANWGTNLRALEQAEQLRVTRQKGYAQRLQWTRAGNPDYRDKSGNRTGAGFFVPVFGADGLLDLSTLGPPLKGPDGRDLQGADTLGKTISSDADKILEYSDDIEKQNKEFERVSTQVTDTELRLRRMGDIRDEVQAERYFLETFEVNVYETRETVLRRKKQLLQRLAELR
jgi:hypothetical protein